MLLAITERYGKAEDGDASAHLSLPVFDAGR